MKKINSVVLSTLTAAFLVGCGGGGGSSTDSASTTDTTIVTPASTTVLVTKGPLLMATAVDSSSPVKAGIQIDGTNKYAFTGDITYPITVTGGYVDVNDNGVVDVGDYEFTGKLTSYSTVVTPITTYLGDTSKDAGKAKLAALKTLAGITSDDDLLTKDPSETNDDVLALVASIYQSYPSLMDNDNSNDANTEGNQDLTTKFADYKSVISQGTFEGETVKQKLIRVEQQLRNTSGVDTLTELDVNKMNFIKKNLVGKKLVNGDETYFFRENDVVLGDTTPDFTEILSYALLEDGNLRLNFKKDGKYDVLSVNENKDEYNVTYYFNNSAGNVLTFEYQLTEYSASELTLALSDTLTNEMISGKNITFKDGEDTIVTNFYSNNAYFEEFTDVESGNNDGECSGSWSIDGDNLIINSKCTDSTILETTTVNFTSSPAVNNTVQVTDNAVSMNVTIESISDISYDASFVLTDVMLSGKKVTISDSFGDASFEFKVGGAYTESWVDLDGDSGSCSGNWKVGAGNKVTIENGVCDDNDPAGYLIFNEEPKNGSRFQFNDEDDNGTPYIGTAFIDTISNI